MSEPTANVPSVAPVQDLSRVVALINPKSGEQASAQFVLEELRRLLPNRVVDLGPCFADPSPAAKLIQSAVDGVVVVAGGDGTVSFVMDIMESVDWTTIGEQHKPFITVLPMGTGNDLSRALNFGPGFSQNICCCGWSSCCRVPQLDPSLHEAVSAPKSSMDRWTLEVVNTQGAVVEKHTMNNYFSVGFDAHIANRFDRFRKNHPGLCRFRLANKVWYAGIGVGSLCGEPELGKTVKLLVDGVPYDFPQELKSIVVSNVQSFASGVQLWKDKRGRFGPPQLNDGLLEIQGVFGTWHMSCMQIKLRSATKIAQGSSVTFVISGVHSMQYDGEALGKVREPCTIRIFHHTKIPILTNIKP